MGAADTLNSCGEDRAGRIRRLVDECLVRRAAGEPLSDDELTAAHPELLPELADELRGVALVQKAARLAGVGTATAPHLPPNALPAYQILGEIHRSADSVVYRALERTSRRVVAIKVLSQVPFRGAADRARFELAVAVLGTLKHPNMAAVHEAGEMDGRFYCVTDYVYGQPLDAYVAGGTRLVGATLELFARVCEAVAVAHRHGVLHGNLSPANIRVDETGQPRLLDFCLGPALPNTVGGEAARLPAGDYAWTPPERLGDGPAEPDVSADVYSLGVVLYQMLTGRMPFNVSGGIGDLLADMRSGRPPRPGLARRGIRRELDAIVLKCLAWSPEERYQSAGELAQDVRRHLAGEAVYAARGRPAHALRGRGGRYGTLLGVAALGMMLGMGLLTCADRWRGAGAARVAAEQTLADEIRRRRLAEVRAEQAARELAEMRGRAAATTSAPAETGP